MIPQISRAFATTAKSNNIADNDFLKKLFHILWCPINADNIIESMPVIIHMQVFLNLNINLN